MPVVRALLLTPLHSLARRQKLAAEKQEWYPVTVEASVDKEGVFTSSSACFQVRGSLTQRSVLAGACKN